MFSKTKDLRIKFNFTIGASFVIFIILMTNFYISAKLINYMFDKQIEINFFHDLYFIVFVFVVSILFATKIYYLHYQKKQIDLIFSLKDRKNIDYISMFKLTNTQKFNFFVIVVSRFFLMFTIVLMLLNLISSRVTLSILYFLSLFIIFLFILLVKKLISTTDFEKFKKIEFSGILTEYSNQENKKFLERIKETKTKYFTEGQ